MRSGHGCGTMAAMARVEHRGAAAQEAPMVISPRMVARLIRQIATGLGAIARRRRRR